MRKMLSVLGLSEMLKLLVPSIQVRAEIILDIKVKIATL